MFHEVQTQDFKSGASQDSIIETATPNYPNCARICARGTGETSARVAKLENASDLGFRNR
jgi:hypothetical protein